LVDESKMHLAVYAPDRRRRAGHHRYFWETVSEIHAPATPHDSAQALHDARRHPDLPAILVAFHERPEWHTAREGEAMLKRLLDS
jgi:hypothetical protein